MPTPELPAFTQVSRYAQFRADLGRRETWEEQTARVMGMHRDFYGDRLEAVRDHVEHAERMHLERRALGSQRALQFGGKSILVKNARVYNCVVSFADRLRFFQEMFWLLLCGCGTGFSVQRHHVAHLPPIAVRTGQAVYQIPDTIEGWADSLGVLISSFADTDDSPFPEFRGKVVEFDGSLVRLKGAPLSSGSKAPGPEPLLRALVRAGVVLERAAREYGRLRPIDAYDVAMHASDAVLAGGVRRSASIALFSPDDREMASAKTGAEWWRENPQRQRSNNSAVLLRGETSWEEFRALVESTRQWGEPGFVWSDSRENVVNPCAEISMWPVLEIDSDGLHLKGLRLPGDRVEFDAPKRLAQVSGWQMCNLSTVNGAQATTPARFFEACEAAATFGTLQAGYTSFPYLGRATEEIVRREALLGVSITGMMDCPAVLFDPAVLRNGAATVRTVNTRVAAAIGINRAARSTTLKPEGTTSCLLDTASGIHPHHSRRGIRHVQSNDLEAPLQFFRLVNPHAVEPVAWDDSGTTSVIAFPFEVGPDALTKQDVGALDLLERVLTVRRNWIEPGTRLELCSRPWLRHNVSNTVQVGPDEWEPVARFIFEHRHELAGVSLLPTSADRDYEQAPFVAVYTPEEMVATYGALALDAFDLVESAPPIRLWELCRRFEQIMNLHSVEWEEGLREAGNLWIQRLASLADDLGDGRLAIAAVKDAWAWRRFQELKEKTVPIDWTTMNEDRDDVDHGALSACSGGSCSVTF